MGWNVRDGMLGLRVKAGGDGGGKGKGREERDLWFAGRGNGGARGMGFERWGLRDED